MSEQGSRRRSHVTIRDVAAAAGVSLTTVSHVLSGNRPVAEATRRQVLNAAAALNYRPAGTAQGLATGRSMVIGIQFPFESVQVATTPYFLSLLVALSEEGASHGYSFMLLPPRDVDGTMPAQIPNIDAAVIVNPTQDNTTIAACRLAGIPTITVGRPSSSEAVCEVDVDYESCLFDVVGVLARQGYESIHLLSESDEISFVRDIRAGFERGLGTHRVEGSVVYSELNEVAAGAAATSLLRDRGDGSTAVIASTDIQALGALRAAFSLGLGVPGEVGVIGLGDTVLTMSEPVLSTVLIDHGEIARNVFEALRDAAAAPDASSSRRRTVGYEIRLRGSTR